MGRNKIDVTQNLLRKSVQETLTTETKTSEHSNNLLFNQKTITMANINDIRKMDPIAIIGMPDLRAAFILIYNTRQKNQGGAHFFDREMNFIKKLWADNDWMRNAEPWSLYATILNLAYYGLSIEPIAKAPAYIFPRGGGNKLIYDISAYGDLVLKVGPNRKAKEVGGPYFVYEGDEIRIKDGKIHHDSLLSSTTIVGVWGRIFTELKTNSNEINRDAYDDKYYPMDTILTWKKKSLTPNSLGWTGGVNGQPTLGFLEAKVLKHLLALYPRGVQTKPGVTFGAALDEESDAETAADAAYATAIASITGDIPPDNVEEAHVENGHEPQPPEQVVTPPAEPKKTATATPTFDF